ncbi:MAG: ATP-binding protein [Gammaproteobacteria bacterium]|nr:ATP-binding protein [Gammaproteobacteria bacterium]
MNELTCIQLKSQLSELTQLTEVVKAFGEENGLAMKEIFNLNLVLDELVTNIIQYGYEGADGNVIRIRLWLEGSWIRVELTDDARPFNPLTACPANLDTSLQERAVGGLGIHMVRELMNEVNYRRVGDRNILSLGKRQSVPTR